MVDRVYAGLLSGAFVLRVSRPGKDIRSTDENDFLFRDDSISMRPSPYSGYIDAAPGTYDIGIGGFSANPLILLSCSDGTLAQTFNYYGKVVGASFSTLRIFNKGGTRRIFYNIYGNTY
jgi:hypothetical protein